jgi:hypothetical protein
MFLKFHQLDRVNALLLNIWEIKEYFARLRKKNGMSSSYDVTIGVSKISCWAAAVTSLAVIL